MGPDLLPITSENFERNTGPRLCEDFDLVEAGLDFPALGIRRRKLWWTAASGFMMVVIRQKIPPSPSQSVTSYTTTRTEMPDGSSIRPDAR